MISSNPLDSFVDPEKGRAIRPLTARQWRIPARIELKGEKLFWSEERGRVVQLSRESLGAFLDLAEAPSETFGERILAFAKRWGALELCEYDGPSFHAPFRLLCPVQRSEVFHPRMEDGTPWEPVAAWRRWARRAKAILTVAAELDEGRIAPEEKWRVACWMEESYFPKLIRPKRIEAGWKLLAGCLDYWLLLTDVRLCVEWVKDSRPEVQEDSERSVWTKDPEDGKGRLTLPFMVGGLFGALAAQLVLTISRTDGLAICSGCGVGYVPWCGRRPRAGERHYCKECHDRKVPELDAARAFRNRNRHKPAQIKKRRTGVGRRGD